MAETGDQQITKWHQSLAGIVALFVFGAILTSPCWGLVLILWVMKP